MHGLRWQAMETEITAPSLDPTTRGVVADEPQSDSQGLYREGAGPYVLLMSCPGTVYIVGFPLLASILKACLDEYCSQQQSH